jgi:hypothetical protein
MTASSTPHHPPPRLVSTLSSKVSDAIQDLLSTKAGLVPRSGAHTKWQRGGDGGEASGRASELSAQGADFPDFHSFKRALCILCTRSINDKNDRRHQPSKPHLKLDLHKKTKHRDVDEIVSDSTKSITS